MNVVIMEDESLSAQRLETLLRERDPLIQVTAVLPSVEEAIEWLTDPNRRIQPDLVFMDVHLEDGSAFHIIEKVNLTIPIIFTTAYDTYAIQAFKANSIDYLLKPIDESELAAALNKFNWMQQRSQAVKAGQANWSALLRWPTNPEKGPYKDRFMVTVGTKIKSIEVAQIAYFFYEGKTTYLTTKDGQNLVVEYSLDKVASLLNPQQFFRVNRSHLVSLAALESIHTFSGSKVKLELSPVSRQAVFVSPDRLSDFKTWLGK
ncbi:LytTR family two component transcriptional regulator [Larkinella arboricola]|uniref:LytTR family two component transcriptional regulator n=1 Tax=Larkinella arboricola TaxID=643671 RepID=A0A327WJ71_LARAB|nr:LytTR family DNA-binding domain-containing protein [Larkinella arboricola]RAJ89889.1 LytTR family two component transcriptional regulator [Larkinella arboricola]